jgi:hypothetical protein
MCSSVPSLYRWNQGKKAGGEQERGKGSLQICYPAHVLGNPLALRSAQASITLAWSPARCPLGRK